MNLYKDIVKKFDLKFNEEFNIEGAGDIVYCFKEDGLYRLANNEWCKANRMLLDLIAGDVKIKEKKFEPKQDEPYYYVCFITNNISYTFYEGKTMDILNLYVGNCFKTFEECEQHYEEIYQKIKGGEISGKYI